MVKRFFSLFLSLIIFTSVFGVNITVDVGNFKYRYLDGSGYVELLGFADDADQTMKDIVIPSTVTLNETIVDYPVYGIAANYGFKNTEIRSISGPSIHIISNSFSNCVSLERIDFPNVEKIGQSAFSGCSLLSDLGDLTHLTTLGSYAFSNCKALEEFKAPLLEEISSNAFPSCTNLKIVDTPNLKSVGYSAFSGCTSLESIDLSNITYIGENTFSGTNLKEVNIPNVTGIARGAFYGCSLRKVYAPKCYSIGSLHYTGGFTNCVNLEEVYMPALVNVYGAFKGCTSLKKISLPSIEVIGNNTFEDTGLEEVEFGESLRQIGVSAFANTNLKHLYFPDNLIDLGYHSFMGCKDLESVSIGPNCYNSEKIYFWGCDNLQTVVIREGVEVFDYNYLHGLPGNILYDNNGQTLKGLKNVYLPSTIKEIINMPNIVKNNGFNMICKGPAPEVTGSSQSIESMKIEVLKPINLYCYAEYLESYKTHPVLKFCNIYRMKNDRVVEPVKQEKPTDLPALRFPIENDAIQSDISRFRMEIQDFYKNMPPFILFFNVEDAYVEENSEKNMIKRISEDDDIDEEEINEAPQSYYQFNIEGLIPETTYTYNLSYLNPAGFVLHEKTGEFTILPQISVGIEEIGVEDNMGNYKFFTIDGRVLNSYPTHPGIYIQKSDNGLARRILIK